MPDPKTFVIAGAGLAGAKAAQTLREEGFDGRVVLVGAEPELPYERPPLSKSYMAGETPRDAAHVHPEAFYADQDIELLRGVAVTGLDPGEHRVELAGGRELRYDRLLIATGAVPRRPPIPGSELPGVHVLRSLADADALRAALSAGGPVAIVGAGWIGCEVAAAARTLGAEVTLVEQGDAPLERVLGRELGDFFAGVHREHGVRVLTGAAVAGIEGPERVERLRFAGGDAIECATVLIAVGVAPDTRLAAAAGLDVRDGIAADDRLQTASTNVYVAGDAAAAFHPRYGREVRVEHWANALNQGPAAARSMLGRGEPYARLPYFYSDQYDVGMEYAGLHAPQDRLVVRPGPDGRPLLAFWLDGADRATAGLHLGDWDAIEPIKRLIESGARLDAGRLADPGVALDEIAGSVAPAAG